MKRLLRLTPFLLALWATSSVGRSAQDTQLDELEARRASALTIARSYVNHRWRAQAANRFHGLDEQGVPVDTPDVGHHASGWSEEGWNVGVPYQWGGFSSLEEFDRGVSEGLYAGHLHTGKRAAASRNAVGVDCSGFVSRCWDLPYKQSTRSIGTLCYELDGFEALQLGDVLNRFDAHVMLFVGWVDDERTSLRTIEAVAPRVLETEHAVSELKAAGYVPLRYRPMDARWRSEGLSFTNPTHAFAGEGGRFIPDPEVAAAPLDSPELAFEEARAGDWVTLRTTTHSADEPSGAEVRSLGVVGLDAKEATLHLKREEYGKELETLERMSRDEALLVRWLSLAVSEASKANERQIRTALARPGFFELAGQSFPARRVELDVLLLFGEGSSQVPVEITMEVIQSDAVPLVAMLRAEHHVEIDFGPEQDLVVVDGTTEVLAFYAQ